MKGAGVLLTTVGLIASQNGLGHARRLVHYSSGLQKLGYKVVLYVSNRQSRTLAEEISSISSETKVYEIGCHGLDGPTYRIDQTIRIPDELEEKLRKHDFVISDNLTWPGRILDSFILMGHFSWIDYWQIKNSSKFSPLIEQAINESKQISSWFTPRDFSHFSQEFQSINKVEIPLSKYETDNESNKSQAASEIWFANGTTGLNGFYFNKLEAETRKLGLELKSRETHKFKENPSPLLVLGRPGMGTIRDCLASNIPFLPCWAGEDAELSRNQDTLKRTGLIPCEWEGNQEPDLEIIQDLSLNRDVRNRISQYWFENSAPIVKILSLMGF